MADLAVRRLGPDDWERARELRLASLRQDAHAFSSRYADALGFDEATWRRRLATATTFHAVLEGRSVGCATVRWDADGEPGDGSLSGMWVDPAARGRGAGDLLVDAVVQDWRAHGGVRVTLWCVTTNVPALRLYRRHGFEPTGRLLREPGHPEELELARPL